jgi:hypothetical protein
MYQNWLYQTVQKRFFLSLRLFHVKILVHCLNEKSNTSCMNIRKIAYRVGYETLLQFLEGLAFVLWHQISEIYLVT